VTADRLADLKRARDRVTDADIVELRLDGVKDVDVGGALEGRTRPVVVTCRPVWEGGRFEGDEGARLRLLATAIRLGAEFVDVEWRADWRSLPRGDRTHVILSMHDFDGMPPDLNERVHEMRVSGTGMLKVAVTAHRLRDCLTLRDAVAGAEPVVAIAMGTPGRITRICPWLVGSPWTYAGNAAPGQLPASELARTYRVRATSASTAVYGIAGAPLAHSASPAMHNLALAESGLDAVYVPLETADAGELFDVAEAFGIAGISVTAPLKSRVVDGVGVDELSRRVGAVNTLRRRGGQWEGRNFDAAGFMAPLERRGVALAGRRVIVLGAGGAARAALWALKAHGARVEVSARRPEEAERLARELHVGVAAWPPPPGWDVLVNATTVGTWPGERELPVAASALTGGLVYDLVYNPPDTALLAAARAAGAQTISGIEMLVGQACRQFEWWTGLNAPVATIERGALEFVQQHSVTP
jgi:3-dehydroquinate dehydratase/shikimate dehydrogenase